MATVTGQRCGRPFTDRSKRAAKQTGEDPAIYLWRAASERLVELLAASDDPVIAYKASLLAGVHGRIVAPRPTHPDVRICRQPRSIPHLWGHTVFWALSSAMKDATASGAQAVS